MLDFIYEEGNEELLDFIKPLWEQLNEEHRHLSRYFSSDFASNNFEKRKAGLIEQTKKAIIRVDLVKVSHSNKYIGYCVSKVDKQKVGEVESLYIENKYRKSGIGGNLIKKVLSWMDSIPTEKKIINVAYGNEKVFSFYGQYGFYPRSYILEQTGNTQDI